MAQWLIIVNTRDIPDKPLKGRSFVSHMGRLNYERNATRIDVSCCRSRSRCGRGIYESTTTGGGGVLGAAPRPSHLPTFPVGGPPESVTLSIILDDNDDAG